MEILKLPVGIDNFEKIRRNNFYYIDKTKLVEQALHNWSEVTLFTRPRRFGKTLGMSMLRSFFEIGTDKSLFDGLYISQNKSLCDEHMGKYPVIFISLKDVEGLSYDEAFQVFSRIIGNEISKFSFLAESDKLTVLEKEQFKGLLHIEKGKFIFDKDTFTASLKLLSQLLYKHYGQKVVILIDEYDVPLDKAYQNGYYHEMVSLIRGLFGQALKTNDYLQFAILTGCLRISKESIFTGLNNFEVVSIMDSMYDECFGFTDKEVQEILKYFDLSEHYADVKEWYDGYHFGDFDVYCPWDVMNYLLELQHNPQAKPVSYWKNTSDNAIIRSFIDHSGSSITKKLENLMAGETIVQRVDENLTYDYLHSSEDNLWSMLYLTGYLTKARNEQTDEVLPDGAIALMIPNEEIRDIFETTVIQWFDDSTRKWNRTLLFDAVWNGDSVNLTKEMNILLRRTISYHDYKEDFYHAFLAGIFTGAGYMVDSNKEHGEGRSDVVVYDPVNGRVAIFEAKYTKNQEKLESTCNTALQQIDERLYAKEYEDDYDQILCYGISFFKKRCLVKIK